MHMPGFTAEFALYESHEGHQGQTVEHGHEQVIPQLRFSCLVRAGKMFLDSVGEGILDRRNGQALRRHPFPGRRIMHPSVTLL